MRVRISSRDRLPFAVDVAAAAAAAAAGGDAAMEGTISAQTNSKKSGGDEDGDDDVRAEGSWRSAECFAHTHSGQIAANHFVLLSAALF
eukprot:m.34294 g.34294  ORF g.34294 m.34294 type:complete len:89 (-) comp11133_c0_seq1:89-355(-)